MNSAVKRLTKDFQEIAKNPMFGTNAVPLSDNNLYVWHCTTIVPEGSPYSGIPLHWVMEFPSEYPLKAPNAYFLTHVAYWGGATAHDDKGRTYLCLDLFGNFDKVHTEWKNNVGSGWSPSYTVSTILLQFQSALMDSNFLSNDARDIARTKKEALALTCQVSNGGCGHNGSSPDKYYPPIPDDEAVLTAQMEAKADLGLDKQFICYASRNSLRDDSKLILGYGIQQNKNRQGRVMATTSPCEYLSEEAYRTGTRQSTQKEAFTNWLPIYINTDHWTRAKSRFGDNLKRLAPDSKVSEARQALDVLSSLMNSAVVSVMNARDPATTSDRFLEGYYAFYRLLLEYKSDLSDYADQQIADFLKNQKNRNKNVVANLGDWLILLTMSSKYRWADVAETFIQECDARNVFWYVKGSYNSPGRYPELAQTGGKSDPQRCSKVFSATQVSRSLVCFQTKFLEFIEELNVEELDANYGIPSEERKVELKQAHAQIAAMKNWDDYFRWNRMTVPTQAQRERQLVTAVELSNAQGYTGGGGGGGGQGGKRRGGRR